VKTLRELAALLFRVDPPPSARLSHLVGINQRRVQYWLAGRDETPQDVIETVEGQLKAVRDFGLATKVDEFVRNATNAGIRPQVLAQYFDQAVDSLNDKPTDS
jgi:hypothetical protein